MTTCKLLICGVHELEPIFAKHDDIHTILSIRDKPADSLFDNKQESVFRTWLKQHCRVQVQSFYFKDYRKRRPPEGLDLPTELDVDRMKSLVPSLAAAKGHVLFHCNAGVSRSTAFAYIMLRETGMSVQQTQQEIRRLRPVARPNPRITNIYELSQKSFI